MRAFRAAAVRHGLLVAAFAAAGACNKGNPAGPTNPPPPASQWIVVGGISTLSHPGDTSQLTVKSVLADGSTKDVTAEATWKVDSGVVSVRAGLLTAVMYGHGLLTVTHASVSQTIPVRVLPEGMFLLTGRVAANGIPVPQAKVEATSAADSLSTLTDASGAFALPAAGAVTVRVEKFGYEVEITQVSVERDERVDFTLRSTESSMIVRGNYMLTFTASPSCALPSDLMQRTYQAQVEEGKLLKRPEDLIVTLTGADFVGWGNVPGFTGTVSGTTVMFTISDNIFDDDYALIERVGNRDLHYVGTAAGALTSKGIAATFSGKISVEPATGSGTIAQCQAADHRLELVR